MDILTNKQYLSYDKLSRYSCFPVYYNRLDDKYVTGTTSYLRNDTPSKPHTCSGKETYDILALKYYNNPTLYWVICSFNNVQDPFEIPKKGKLLYIPTLSSIHYNI